MSTILIRDFKGELPKRDPLYLPDTYAQAATDVRLTEGTLRPVRKPRVVTTLPAGSQTVFRFASEWRSWPGRVNPVPGPVASKRLYITGDGVPKMEVGSTPDVYDLALPAPASPMDVSTTVTPDPLAETYEEIVYAFTWVTTLGEESGPSPLTARIGWSEGSIVFDNFPDPPANRGVYRARIYQSATGLAGTTELFFRGDLALGQIEAGPVDGFNPGGTLNEPLPTQHFSAPPDDMEGLTAMPNGMMAAFSGRELMFSEPYQPHAWPEAYRLSVDTTIVGLAAFGSQLAVLTIGTPYRAQGTHPAQMVMEKIEQNLPCLSHRGIVDMGYSAIYPSTHGLVEISSGGARVITDPIFTREQWQNLEPESIVAAAFDRQYVFTFDGDLPGSGTQTGIIDLTGDQPFLIRSTVDPAAMYYHVPNGNLYMLDAAGELTSWDDQYQDENEMLTWRSKLFELPFPTTFSAFELRARSGTSASARIYCDGALLHTVSTINRPMRLPPKRGEQWQIEIDADGPVTSVCMAPSLGQLAS